MRLKRNYNRFFLTHAKPWKRYGWFVTQGGQKYYKSRGWKKFTHKNK